MPTHFSDFIEMGMSAQQTGFTIRLRRREYQPSCSCPVERGATRVARHVRERLLEVNNLSKTNPNLQILSHALSASANAGERDTPAAVMRWVGLVQSGCEAFERRFKSRRWDSDQSRKANRVQCPQVRLTHAGVGSFPVATPRNRRLTTSGVLPTKRRP